MASENVKVRAETRKLEEWKGILKIIAVVLVAGIVLVAFDRLVDGKFLNTTNIRALFSHAVVPSFVAWGLCFIFACNYTDMSIGAVIILAANAAGTLGNIFGYAGVIFGGLIVGMSLVILNFTIYVYTNIPSWIAGIGMAMVYEAVCVFYSNYMQKQGLTVVELSSDFRKLGQAPYIYIVFIAGFIIVYYIYNKTQAGLNIRALGSGLEVSRALGINVRKTLMSVGVIAGLFVGCAAFISESYNVRMSAKTGLTSMSSIFQPMAALLLAKVLQRKVNLVVAIPICSLIIYTIFNMLTMMGVPSGTWQEAVLGVIIIGFGIAAQNGEKGVIK